MTSFNVLDRATPIHQHYLLEASAGTGKTFSIENIVVRLLVEGASPLPIDKILVVTFTRAAASDLRTRIRSNLEKTLHYLHRHEGCPDYVAAWIDEGAEAISNAKKRIEQALFCYDQAAIFTIHGFCSRMLRRYALEGDIGLDASGGEESLPTSEILAVIRNTFRTEVTAEAFSPAQLEILLKGDPDQTKLLNILKKEGCIATSRPYSVLLQEFQRIMKRLKESVIATDLVDDFTRQAAAYKNHKSHKSKGEILKKVERFAALFDKDTLNANDFDTLLTDGLVWTEALEPSLLKKQPPPISRYPGFTEQLRKELYPIVKEGGDFSIILARMAHICQQMLQRFRDENERMTPDDLLIKMSEALDKQSFSEHVRSLYQAAIIDEFQDTDPRQWDIFQRLFMSEESPWPGYLYLVGDPKQSIYAFRQADIYTYLEAREALGPNNTASLDTNYRSRPSLIQALNSLFNTPEWLPLPKLNTDLPYRAVKAADTTRSDAILDDRESVHFFISENGSTLEEAEKNCYFPFIAHEIERLHQDHGLSYSRFAILVRDRRQSARLTSYLKEHKIPYVNKRSASLAESHAVPALISLIQAVLHPRDISAVKTALGCCLIGWDDPQIRQLDNTDAMEKIFLQIHALRQRLIHDGIAQFFQDFLQSRWHGLEGKNVWERLLGQEGGIDIYHDAQQIADLLADHQCETGTTAERLIDLLDEFAAWADNDDKRIKVRQDLSGDGVRILTLHLSKGLEFDIVFALGLVNRTSMKDDLIPIQKGSTRVYVPAPEEDDPDYRRHCEEIDAEKMRQLYVAMTRAKDRLYIPVALHFKKKPKIGEASPMELFLARFNHPPAANLEELYQRIVEGDGKALTDYIDKHGKEAHLGYTKTSESQWNEKPNRHTDQPVLLVPPPSVTIPKKTVMATSFSSLTVKQAGGFHPESEASHDLENQEKSAHTLPASAETGIIFHTILEKISFHEWKGLKDGVELVKPYVQDTSLKGWDDTVAEVIRNAMQTELRDVDEGFCLAELQPDQMYREMPFLFPHEGTVALEEFEMVPGFLKGVIDLIFTWKGKYFIADWKTNRLGSSVDSYTRDKVGDSMWDHHYFLQGEIYAQAWKRYLKFIDQRPFEECFGGIFYLYLRGLEPRRQPPTGIYHFGSNSR